jgi:hypothetical protein
MFIYLYNLEEEKKWEKENNNPKLINKFHINEEVYINKNSVSIFNDYVNFSLTEMWIFEINKLISIKGRKKIIEIAIDLDNNKFFYRVNGTYFCEPCLYKSEFNEIYLKNNILVF